jgi:hypothetical protein
MEIFILLVKVAAIWVLCIGLRQLWATKGEKEECELCGEWCGCWCSDAKGTKP